MRLGEEEEMIKPFGGVHLMEAIGRNKPLFLVLMELITNLQSQVME